MPWTLLYPLTTPEERDRYRQELAQLRQNPDVEFVEELRRGEGPPHGPRLEAVADPPGERVVLVVRFVDELERTNDDGLRTIREQRVLPSERERERASRQELFVTTTTTLTPEPPWPEGQITPEARDRIISTLIASPEGRTRLAASMAAPLRRNLDYQSIARRTFMVEELPAGALPIYDRDPDLMARILFDTPIQPLTLPPTGGQAFIAAVIGSQARIEGLHGMSQAMVGRYLELRGGGHPGNNGIFPIVGYISPTSVQISNSTAVLDLVQHYQWADHSLVAATTTPIILEPQGVIEDFEAMHGHRREPAWTRVLDDSFLDDD